MIPSVPTSKAPREFPRSEGLPCCYCGCLAPPFPSRSHTRVLPAALPLCAALPLKHGAGVAAGQRCPRVPRRWGTASALRREPGAAFVEPSAAFPPRLCFPERRADARTAEIQTCRHGARCRGGRKMRVFMEPALPFAFD